MESDYGVYKGVVEFVFIFVLIFAIFDTMTFHSNVWRIHNEKFQQNARTYLTISWIAVISLTVALFLAFTYSIGLSVLFLILGVVLTIVGFYYTSTFDISPSETRSLEVKFATEMMKALNVKELDANSEKESTELNSTVLIEK